VRRQYDSTVRLCALAFVRPLADFADLVIEGTESLDFKVEQVMSALKKRGLLSRAGLPGSAAGEFSGPDA
jgi:uridine kinase